MHAAINQELISAFLSIKAPLPPNGGSFQNIYICCHFNPCSRLDFSQTLKEASIFEFIEKHFITLFLSFWGEFLDFYLNTKPHILTQKIISTNI